MLNFAVVLVIMTILGSIHACSNVPQYAGGVCESGSICRSIGFQDTRLKEHAWARWDCPDPDNCTSNVIVKNDWVHIRKWCQRCFNYRHERALEIGETSNRTGGR
ncbi:hypothetical protein PGTUg99_013759 [Puccinia graminis f. sp. tritici]|uniref:Uncharacterized protein n=1 Tax=Puccinia graminis f. sp. tritici TaxID=56615 RepID=A0A5B0NTP1_PUCGR|nr:hypothetical protein PGTUg99_013759 [Puccinia graminis f. sp. tritici]